jgi:conjugative transfer signal peptidase TraF
MREDYLGFPTTFSRAHHSAMTPPYTHRWEYEREGRAAARASVILLLAIMAIFGTKACDRAPQMKPFRLMLTDSSAWPGIYHVGHPHAAGFKRGALVEACLPPWPSQIGLEFGYLAKGDCPGGAEPVAKVIGAVPGDVVELLPGAVTVNGQHFTHNAATQNTDSENRALKHLAAGRYVVARGEVWLFGFNNPRSWDSRYFGPVPVANVMGTLSPTVRW